MEVKRYHKWENRHGKLVCLDCGMKGNGIADMGQNCSGPPMGNLFETIIAEAELQPTEELQPATQEA